METHFSQLYPDKRNSLICLNGVGLSYAVSSTHSLLLMHLLLSLLFSLGIVMAAVLSVQNATAISIHFLAWRLVPLPMGIVLAFAWGAGVLGGAIAISLWSKPQLRRPRYPKFKDSEFTDDTPY